MRSFHTGYHALTEQLWSSAACDSQTFQLVNPKFFVNAALYSDDKRELLYSQTRKGRAYGSAETRVLGVFHKSATAHDVRVVRSAGYLYNECLPSASIHHQTVSTLSACWVFYTMHQLLDGSLLADNGHRGALIPAWRRNRCSPSLYAVMWDSAVLQEGTEVAVEDLAEKGVELSIPHRQGISVVWRGDSFFDEGGHPIVRHLTRAGSTAGCASTMSGVSQLCATC